MLRKTSPILGSNKKMSPITPKLIVEWFIKDIWKIIIIFILFASISVYYALSIPNIYSSKAVVSSNLSDSKSMGGSLAKLGGLASLAGVSLGGGGMSPEVIKEMVSSNSFIASFVRAYKLEAYLMAAEKYDASSNTFLFNNTIYDNNEKKWTRAYKFPLTQEPNDAELAIKFKELFSVSFARKTKLITLNFKSLSPEFSKTVLEDLIFHFNEYMRKGDIETSQSSIGYLEQQLATTQYNEVKLALQQIMEEQFKKLAIANTRKEYALRVIEAPLLAANKSEPKRAVICAVITFAGTLLSILLLWSVRIMRGK